MRHSASKKQEIIRLVERSHLPVRRTLDKLGIPGATFYRWYDRYRDNYHRYHESLGNLTLADVYFGRDHAIIERRRKTNNSLSENAAWTTNSKPLNINNHELQPPLENISTVSFILTTDMREVVTQRRVNHARRQTG